MQRIYKIDRGGDYLIRCTFFSGEVKELNIEKYIAESVDDKENRVIQYGKLMDSMRISKLKTAVEFDYNISIDAEEMWNEGVLVEQVFIDDIHIRLAEWITRLRERADITQTELAKITGIYQAEVSKIERGIGNPSLDTIRKVAEGLGYRAVVSFEKKSNDNMTRDSISKNYLRLYKCQGDYTIDDMDALPEECRCELIDGFIYDMAMPTVIHQKLIFELALLFSDFIKKHKGECEVLLAPFELTFEDDDKTSLAPDLAVICNKDIVNAQRVCGAPDFILEVVSEGNAKRDYGTKLNIYREKGVREYWIIDPIKRRLVAYDFEVDEIPVVFSLDSEAPVKIYDGKLRIDLQCVEDIIKKYEDQK